MDFCMSIQGQYPGLIKIVMADKVDKELAEARQRGSIAEWQRAATASTMAFATLTLARLFHGFNCRSKHNIFKLGFSSNWYSLGAFAAGVVLLGIVMFVPFMQNLFSVTPLTQSQLINVCLLAAVPTVLIQMFKIIRDIKHRK